MWRAWVDDDEMWSPSGTFAGVVGGLVDAARDRPPSLEEGGLRLSWGFFCSIVSVLLVVSVGYAPRDSGGSSSLAAASTC